MTEEEKLKIYKEGFKDGFAEGYKQVNTYSGPIGAAGAVHNKPIKPNEPLINHSLDYSEYESEVYRRKETGAVGSDYFNKTPVSSNGAAGY